MSDATASNAGETPNEDANTKRLGSDANGDEALWVRLLFMLGFWFLGNLAFSISIFLGALQFVVILVRGEANAELKTFSRNLIQFVWQCLAYVTFNQDEKPFPLNRFPDTKNDD
ncbi:DUF4389 domain-containing protein [Pyruvatibacter sp.]|uniref:DUF4389 domain-containing protein n=1 Tax=Pyruvatibacter sp. TaxID=1981328 RepID=UPI002969E4CC|nr:DUF4389 domain-containing protein [Alphaproteobacteria bacterium]